MADEMELLKEWIKTSKNIVFFGGAGVSTESNIPDFINERNRTSDGFDVNGSARFPIARKCD